MNAVYQSYLDHLIDYLAEWDEPQFVELISRYKDFDFSDIDWSDYYPNDTNLEQYLLEYVLTQEADHYADVEDVCGDNVWLYEAPDLETLYKINDVLIKYGYNFYNLVDLEEELKQQAECDRKWAERDKYLTKLHGLPTEKLKELLDGIND